MPLSSCLCVLPVDLVFVTFILVLVCLCLWLSLAFSVLNIVDPDGRIKGYSPQYWKDRKYVLWKQQRNIVGRINNFILYIHIQVECFSTFKLGLFFFFQRSLRSRRFTVGSHFFTYWAEMAQALWLWVNILFHVFGFARIILCIAAIHPEKFYSLDGYYNVLSEAQPKMCSMWRVLVVIGSQC